jgi:uncharacterized protein YndB with AHSA1/START domain
MRMIVLMAMLLPLGGLFQEKRADPLAVHYEFSVSAPPADVWAAWTTDAGLRTFFGPSARIELKTFGRFDVHFDPNAAAGQRGAEGNIVLAYEPERMLTTTWDAPPKFPSARAQRTFLQIRLEPADRGTTRVTIHQTGFGSGSEWRQVHEYFLGAWTWVAAALQQRFEAGPIDWNRPPDLLPKMKAIGGETAVRWAAAQR